MHFLVSVETLSIFLGRFQGGFSVAREAVVIDLFLVSMEGYVFHFVGYFQEVEGREGRGGSVRILSFI